eukprot:CAMPEP_0183738228 /NCGR_PEP_ID=MMETSP0737-20130205/54044_1 /TAXON_ID=385413 /ORGANISM="Thalassiosira miniscula, Strain CCMP1093" /LENGTH=47 /DNA_ID= /DNA_START= /DNA_END= /DNA_ORIENTATION=
MGLIFRNWHTTLHPPGARMSSMEDTDLLLVVIDIAVDSGDPGWEDDA